MHWNPRRDICRHTHIRKSVITFTSIMSKMFFCFFSPQLGFSFTARERITTPDWVHCTVDLHHYTTLSALYCRPAPLHHTECTALSTCTITPHWVHHCTCMWKSKFLSSTYFNIIITYEDRSLSFSSVFESLFVHLLPAVSLLPLTHSVASGGGGVVCAGGGEERARK